MLHQSKFLTLDDQLVTDKKIKITYSITTRINILI